ncbi:ABC transporter permease [Asaia platycodi]|uniref:ABC transporter permease n=1 Tax=Asaia platycodi TaxID=610243 RepID=UPI00046FE422|nr:ABC transporter permease [Asaia platycodi]
MNTTQPRAGDREKVLDLYPLSGWARYRAAFVDLRQGLSLLPLAMTLGWLDIKMRYRGSILGPFWLTISTAVMVAALGFLYAELFGIALGNYLPFLALSLVLWGYISTLITESTTVFSQASSLIQSARTPFSVFALQVIVRNFLVLAHNAAVVLVVFLIFHVVPHKIWLVVPALVLWSVDSFAIMLCLGLLGARFRDIPPIIVSLLQVFFFITPVIWRPELVGPLADWLLLDPFHPLLAIVRAPLIGESLSPLIWEAALAHSAILIVAAALFFARFRARIAYWV